MVSLRLLAADLLLRRSPAIPGGPESPSAENFKSLARGALPLLDLPILKPFSLLG